MSRRTKASAAMALTLSGWAAAPADAHTGDMKNASVGPVSGRYATALAYQRNRSTKRSRLSIRGSMCSPWRSTCR
jgi:hypothetical protein